MSYNSKTNMYEGYIYKITNKVNNKVYIGKTIKTIDERFKQHLNQAEQGNRRYLYCAIRKYGKNNFIVEEIEKIERLTKEDLNKDSLKLETKYIKIYNSYNDGYNLTVGETGSGNIMDKKVYQYCLETGEFIREYSSTSNAREITNITSISQACNGHQYSAGGYLWSYKKYGTHPNAGFIQKRNTIPIDKYSMLGEYLKTYNSLTEAEEENNCNNLCYVLSGRYVSCGGFLWCRHGEMLDTTKLNFIDKYNLNGEFICTYPNASEAKKDTNCHISAIYKCCRGEIYYVGNYVWRFHNEPYDHYTVKFKIKKINKYSLDGKYLNSYDSAQKAMDSVGIKNYDSLIKCLKHKCDNWANFKWYYIDDLNQPDKTKIINYKEVIINN